MTIDRRAFLAAAALPALVHAVDEPIIIDTHTHFYDPTRPEGVPWPSKSDALLYRKILPADYRAIKQPLRVTGTIVVEASPWVEDNQWLLDLAAKEPFIMGIIGNLAPTSDDFSKNWKRFAANPLFRGIRISHAQIIKADRKALLADLGRLIDDQRTLDVNGGPNMLADVNALARDLPKLRIVVNHMANVRIDGQAPPREWQTAMQRLAECPNVYCKVSALVEGTGRNDGRASADLAFYLPTLDLLWKAFGKERLLYGSNWKVSERFAPLSTVQQLIIDYCQRQGGDTRDWLFARSALAAYQPKRQ